MIRDVLAERTEIEHRIAGLTVCTDFVSTSRRHADEVALRFYPADGQHGELTWGGYADGAARVAGGLAALGVGRGDHVAMLLRTRPEFHLTDIGAQLAGATPVSLYNSSPPDQIHYFLEHCAAPVVVCDDAEFAGRVLSVRDRLPTLRHVVVRGSDVPPGTVPYDQLRAADPVDLDAAAAGVRPEDITTVIYTSGTTGRPKGVMLSHRNMKFCVESFSSATAADLDRARSISYLPMAHIAERLVTHYLHIRFATQVTLCPDITQLVRYMIDVRPTLWFCAPRMWEKLHAALTARIDADPTLAADVRAAQEIGLRHAALANEGDPIPADLAEAWAKARAEVIEPMLATVGLDQTVCSLTGSAPMPRQVLDFFTGSGLPLSDCYGQSESSGVISWDPRHIVAGTSGKSIPGVEARIAPDGEVCARGPQIFTGYLNDPERTALAVDADGWLHTGDLGSIDDGGNLRILGRRNEMLVPTSGHNVSPSAIEAKLKESPLIGQACVVGHGRPRITALLVLDRDGLASRYGCAPAEVDLAAAALDPDVLDDIAVHVIAVNDGLPNAERVRAHRVLGEEWLPDTDLMTPTSKMKRAGIGARYVAEIDALYS
jgi:long-chain acyl-CoA synthetase